jgi:hypothetical protein
VRIGLNLSGSRHEPAVDRCEHGNTDKNGLKKRIPYNTCLLRTNRKLEIFEVGLHIVDGWIVGRLAMTHQLQQLFSVE